MKPRVVFVCTGNAGRSQMAEAMLRHLAGDAIEVFSAGVDPWPEIHPMARKLIAERGDDVRGHEPKHVMTFLETPTDYVITIGDQALAECPKLAGNPERIHWDIGDPAAADGTPDSEAIFRSTQRQIEQRLSVLLDRDKLALAIQQTVR